MIESEIRWGTGFDNALSFAHPQLLDDFRTYRKPAPGSRRTRNAAGTTDAWINKRDFCLAGRARYFKGSAWGGLGLQDFLDSAGEGNTFRFIPDNRYPNFYVGDCYLGEPFDDPQPQLEQSDGSQSIDIVIRQQAFDFNLAMRGLMFEYVPGKSLTDPAVATFSRASIARRIGRDGLVATDASGALRDRHFEGSVRAALLEITRTNSLLHNSDFSNAAWVKTDATVTTGIADPAGGLTACTLTATGANADIRQSLANGAGIARTNSLWMRRRTGTGTVTLHDPTGLAGTNPTLTSSWQRVRVVGNSSIARNMVILITTSGDEIDVWMAQQDDASSASSEIATTTAAVTRATDQFSYPFLFVPQELTVYCKLVDKGTSVESGEPGIWGIAAANGAQPRLMEYGSAGTYITQHQSTAAVEVTSPAIAYGDTVETRSVLRSTGTVQRGTSINSGAEATSGESAAPPAGLATAWGGTIVHIGGRGTGLVGLASIVVLKIAAGVKTMAEMRAA